MSAIITPKTECQPVIQVSNLVAHYAGRQILNGIDLEVYEGEILVIMGSSGSGKSTLLRHMLGLKQPTSGHVRLLGKDLGSLNRQQLYTLRRQLGVAFQGGALLGSLNVGENVELPLHEHTDLDADTIRVMARMKLEMMNLSDFDSLMPAELSGGMLKRAGLARALVMDPKLLFFDEPSAGLDPVAAVELDELILNLRDAMGMTIVVVTHELESAFKIADRITVLDEGRLVITGSRDEVRATDNQRVQDLFNRRPRNEVINRDDYLHRLTGYRHDQ